MVKSGCTFSINSIQSFGRRGGGEGRSPQAKKSLRLQGEKNGLFCGTMRLFDTWSADIFSGGGPGRGSYIMWVLYCVSRCVIATSSMVQPLQ